MDTYKDDRTEEQRATHTELIGGIDGFMSSWGPPKAENRRSRAYWACKPEHAIKVVEWVEGRSDIKYVTHYKRNVPSRIKRDYVHIYVVDDEHPALINERASHVEL